MAPLTNEIRPVSSCSPPHLGPPIPEVSSVWFKLFLYSLTKCGPPSLLLTKGTRLRVLPKIFRDHEKLLVTTWAHDPSTVQMSNALPILNDALCHSSVLVQGQGSVADFHYIPFPLQSSRNNEIGSSNKISTIENHHAIQILSKELDLKHNCGYITMMRISQSYPQKSSKKESFKTKKIPLNASIHSISVNDDFNKKDKSNKFSFECENNRFSKDEAIQENEWLLLDCAFGIPLFEESLNKKVCRRLLEERLCDVESLKNQIASSRKLCLQILEFISKNQPVICGIDSGRNISFQPNHPGCDTELPLPSVNLMFYQGVLSVWDQFTHR